MTIIFSSESQQNSEVAYAEWLSNNPKGFVVNCLKTACGTPTRSNEIFTCIHKASCNFIRPPKEGFTTGSYQKLCSNTYEEAEAGARRLAGLLTIKRCGFCIKQEPKND